MSELIPREEALMCLTGEYLEGQEYKLDDEIHKFIKRIQNVPPVPAIPISVIEEIKAEINKALSEETISDNRQQISDVGVGLELALNFIDRHIKEYEA